MNSFAMHGALTTHHTRRRGFSMVEMMVALLVLSVGMLGVASLFATSLNSGSSAIARMQAVSLVNDLADRIRANRTAGTAYQGAASNKNCVGGAIGAVTCVPADMAANDLYVWNQQIAAAWPGGSAAGTVVATGPDVVTNLFTYTIKVVWSEPGQQQQLSYSLTVQL